VDGGGQAADAASGDKHDYLSLAPYWWPSQPQTPDNPLGCPYVEKDGVRNPATDAIPTAGALTAFSAIYQLSLAWYYTGNAAYAKRAALDLRTWFLDPATRMNPNLNFAQGIPRKTDGRGNRHHRVLLHVHPGPRRRGHSRRRRAWLAARRQRRPEVVVGDFLTWLRTSQNGKDEAAQANNHGTFYDMLSAGIALYTGQKPLARQIVQDARGLRIDQQIEATATSRRRPPAPAATTTSPSTWSDDPAGGDRQARRRRPLAIRTPQGGSLFKAVDF